MPEKRFASTDVVRAVLDIFTVTPLDTTIPIPELVEKVVKPERVIRDAVARLVEQGVPIIPDRDGGGYKVTSDQTLIIAEVRRLRSQALKMTMRANALDSHLLRVLLSSDKDWEADGFSAKEMELVEWLADRLHPHD